MLLNALMHDCLDSHGLSDRRALGLKHVKLHAGKGMPATPFSSEITYLEPPHPIIPANQCYHSAATDSAIEGAQDALTLNRATISPV